MRKGGKTYEWILIRYSDDSTDFLGVFKWVGAATGHVKRLDPGRAWVSDDKGVLSKWVSKGEDIYEIFPVEVNPLVHKDEK